MSENILSVVDLNTSFHTDRGEVMAVNGVSFNLDRGKILGIVGESGSGKSVTAYSIMQILEKNGSIKKGQVLYKGQDITQFSEKQMREFRGKCCSIIFQDPMTSLNPVFTIGNQLKEAIELHTDRKGKVAMDRAIEMLTLVGVNEPEKRVKQYPYELDVTIQAQILELMQSLQKKLGMAIIMVTHDLGVIADMCDEIIVMYGGRVCERGTAEDIFYRPAHEYTKGLLKSIPSVDRMGEKLIPIPGTPINLLNMPKGCAFCPRCENAMKICIEEIPPEIQMPDGHFASCWMSGKEQMEAQQEGKNNE